MFDYQRYMPSYEWWDCSFADFKAIACLMGWDIENIYFSGFSSQGDGACFVGNLGYAKNCAKAVKAYAPLDTELHDIAARWQSLQKRCFYSLWASVKHSGRYYHEYCTSFDIEDSRDHWRALPDGAEDECKEVARDFMRWIYRQLEKEYEYQCAYELARGWEEQREIMADARQAARALVRDMREAIKSGIIAAPSICQALRGALRDKLQQWEEAREEREAIADNFHYRHDGQSVTVSEFAAKYV